MKFIPRKFQQGGEMTAEGAPEEAAAPEAQAAPEEGGAEQDPMAAIAQGAMQALQNQDCQTALQVCQALVQLMQQAQGGQPAEQGEPVYRRGGILVRRIRK